MIFSLHSVINPQVLTNSWQKTFVIKFLVFQTIKSFLNGLDGEERSVGHSHVSGWPAEFCGLSTELEEQQGTHCTRHDQ